MAEFTTACPRNCYSTCALKVRVLEGRIVGIEPHPGNKATLESVCLKGLAYVERQVSPDRILEPLARRKGSRDFKPITWEEAFQRIEKKLKQIRDTTGPQSVLYYTGSGTKGLLSRVGMDFWRLYGGCTTTYGDLCWPAGLEATRLTLGENKHNAPWDMEHAKLILMWGKNPAETNLHQMVFIQRALDKGAKLVVIDPRRTETAERAKLLIQPRPGTDGALALGVAHLLVKNDWIDHDFIEAHVHGFEAFRRRLILFKPEKAAAITEVPESFIHELAHDLGTRKPATLCAGFGMQRYSNSGQTLRTLLALVALTGNLGKRGAGWVYANLQGSVFDPVLPPLADYPGQEADRKVRASISTARLGQEMLKTKDPPLRMAWVERGNPVTQNPDTRTVLKAFRSLEFRVVVDQFLTDTAREADIVLPAKTLFEQTDVISSYWHPYIQIRQKVLDPPGRVKPETEIYRLLAQRMGLEPAEPVSFPESTDEAIEGYLNKYLKTFRKLSLNKLKKGPILAPGHEVVAFKDLRFKTPSGKIELESREAKERWRQDPLPGFQEPKESVRGRGRSLADRFPLYLMTPNTKDRIHSQFNNLIMIRNISDRPRVAIHPVDAGSRGIGDGDRVSVFNDRGRIILEARLDYSLKPGCVCITNGWWLTDGGAVNLCSQGKETDMGHGAAFHDTLVEVRRADHA